MRSLLPLLPLLALGAVACGSTEGAPADAGPDARIVLRDGGDGGADGAVDGGTRAEPPPLPAWFDDARIHAHTRLWKVLAGTPEFAFAATGFEEMGLPVYSRHVKTGSEDPWWPSAVPVVDGEPLLASEPDLVSPMAESAHGSGLRIVGYYWHAADERLAELQPEWVCRDAAGEPMGSGRGLHLDVTGAHGPFAEKRLLELADRGFDGVYLDQHHLPPSGCYGTAVEAAWREAAGSDAPRPGEAEHTAYLAFAAERVAQTLREWRRSLRGAFPDTVLIASASDLPALTLPHASSALLEGADSPKTEFHLALDPEANGGVFEDGTLEPPPDDARMAFGWALLRDGANGRPPHVWAPGLPNIDHARGFVAAVTAWGGVANLDVADSLVLRDMGASPHKTTREVLEDAAGFGTRVSEVLGSARPVRFAAVCFPEAARDARGDDHARAWREVLWPTVGAFDTLADERVPVGVVTDAQLRDGALDGYRLVVVPATGDLDDAQRASLAAFREAGGTVVELAPELPWHTVADRDAARAALLEAAGAVLSEAPVRVVGGPEHLHAVAFERDDGTRIVAVVNGIGWVQTHGETTALDPADLVPAPAPADGVRLELPGAAPSSAHEALTDTELTVTDAGGVHVVELPAFGHLALVVLD